MRYNVSTVEELRRVLSPCPDAMALHVEPDLCRRHGYCLTACRPLRIAPAGATWRSGYAAVCKTNNFPCAIKAHSEIRPNIASSRINRLAADSERPDDVSVPCPPKTRPAPTQKQGTDRAGRSSAYGCPALGWRMGGLLTQLEQNR
jgi:hypothetical protein